MSLLWLKGMCCKGGLGEAKETKVDGCTAMEGSWYYWEEHRLHSAAMCRANGTITSNVGSKLGGDIRLLVA